MTKPPDADSLKEALDKRKGGVRRGVPPVALYWVLRRHGATMAALAEEGASYRVIRERIGRSVTVETLRTALQRMRDDGLYELVGTKNWDGLAKLLFANFPAYESMSFYRRYVAPGETGYDAWQGSKAEAPKQTAVSSRKGRGGQPRLPSTKPPAVLAPDSQSSPLSVSGSNSRTRELSTRRVVT